jgi:hydrogenase-4 component E
MVNYLIVLFAVTLIYLSVAERFRIYAGLMGLQGFLLFGITLIELQEVNTTNLVLIASETVFFKGIVVPFLLFRIIRKTGVYKVHKLAMPGFYLLILTIAALIVSLVLSKSLINPYINTEYMTIALFCLFTGMLLIITHKYILSQVIGFLVIENAVFILSLAVGNKNPMLINIGILLDIFVGVLILGMFALRLKPHTLELTRLKD